MSKVKLYHGSENIIEQPLFGAGKTYNDYGQGFYCTKNMEMAMEWAVDDFHDGYANIYEIDCTDLSILNLNSDSYNILHWLCILLENRQFDVPSPLAAEAGEFIIRHFNTDYKRYDIITGYRADDSYFSFAQDFLNGTISYRQLNNAMHLGNMGMQFVLKSEAAFERIRYIGNKHASRREWLAKKKIRDKLARQHYFNSEKNARMKGDIFITQIIDEHIFDEQISEEKV